MKTTEEWKKFVETCAQACHEINRAYCLSIGDTSQLHWEEAPAWQQDSARKGVEAALRGAGPEQSHEGWCAEKRATGWVHGVVKDPNATPPTHPCLVPYAELPAEQKAKDHLFVATVQNMAVTLMQGEDPDQTQIPTA